jgi:hypothetical protein
MEELIHSDTFKKSITQMIQTYYKIKHSQSFVHYDYNDTLSERYVESVKQFMSNFDQIICEEGLDLIVQKAPSILIFELAKHAPDHHKIELVKCIAKHFSDKIDKDNTQTILHTIQTPQIFLACVEILCKFGTHIFRNCDWRPFASHIFSRYLERFLEVDQLKTEMQDMKNKIHQMELHIKYRPQGEGYLEF